MAGKEAKIATVIIKVDLECSCCSKKIKRALCKLQKRFKINSIVFDEKKNTVTVSGAFNPDCFIKEICCLAYKVIKDIEIKKPDPPAKPSTPPEKPKDKPTPPPEVKIAIRTCCSQPCPCYQPHQGCCRCCSCGHVSSPQPDPHQCPQPCPLPCPKPCPLPCPQQSSKPCPKPCSRPCCQPYPLPCSQPSQLGGYPCYRIVCEEEASDGCSIM